MNDVNMIEEDYDEIQIETTSSVSISSTSSRTPKKKKGVFRKEWLSTDRYSSWLQEVNYNLTKARCKTCLKMFSARCDGKTAVEKHMTSYIHKTSMKTFEKISSLTQFITPECGDPERCARGNLRTEICARKAAHEECCARNDTHGNLHPKKLAHGKKRTDALSTEY